MAAIVRTTDEHDVTVPLLKLRQCLQHRTRNGGREVRAAPGERQVEMIAESSECIVEWLGALVELLEIARLDVSAVRPLGPIKQIAVVDPLFTTRRSIRDSFRRVEQVLAINQQPRLSWFVHHVLITTGIAQ